MQLPGSSIARAVAVAIFLVAGASAAQTQPLAQRQHRVVSLKEALQLAAQKGPDVAREQVLLGVARAYLGLQSLEGLLDAARDAERVALRREEDAKSRIAAGTDVEIALLRAQTDTASARVQIATLEGQQASLL